ncbi:MAG TPA: hypothetical protein PLM81_01990 [Ginsengibacter sp.]|nr:hypothetical protein [Ginsengibacter sp.]HRP17098.1 hypothetical protein [Ginsengibacter sp.]HRP44136.1 hypothetical protein [Ginsengibacter sp.]
MKRSVIYLLGSVLIIVGFYTIITSGGYLLHVGKNFREPAVYIPVATIACFIASIIYVVCGVLFFIKGKWATPLLFVATIIMFVGYIGMLFHINNGKPINNLTIIEMLVRTSGTMLYAAASWFIFTRTRIVYPEGYDRKSFKKLLKEYEDKKIKNKY